MDTIIYTDGSWDPSTKHGGWGLRVVRGLDVTLEDSGHAHDTGINLMELTAFIEGLKICDPGSPVTFATDSRNLIHWLDGSFQTRDPRVRDLVVQARDLIHTRGLNVSYRKVAAHTGVEHNDAVDRLARAAMNRAKDLTVSPPLPARTTPTERTPTFTVHLTVHATNGKARFTAEGRRDGAPYHAEEHLSGDAIDADLAALLHVARAVRPQEQVHVTTRSDNLVKWYSGEYSMKAPRVREAFSEVRRLVSPDALTVTR